MFKNKTKNLIAATAIAALSSAAIATAADSPTQEDSLAATAATRGAAIAHAPLSVRSATPAALKTMAERLRVKAKRLGEAKDKRRAKADSVPSGPVAGVSQSTLDAIGACESGGDPTAVNAGGYYGKYQFDLGTWASVGGSSNPADASEGEQDYRASVLYSRAGSSPWPVCGQ